MKRYADLPPALTLLGVGVLGVLFGFIGVLLATPLLACVHVLFESFAPGCRRQESQSGQETYVPSKASTREGSWQGMAPGVDPQPAR